MVLLLLNCVVATDISEINLASRTTSASLTCTSSSSLMSRVKPMGLTALPRFFQSSSPQRAALLAVGTAKLVPALALMGLTALSASYIYYSTMLMATILTNPLATPFCVGGITYGAYSGGLSHVELNISSGISGIGLGAIACGGGIGLVPPLAATAVGAIVAARIHSIAAPYRATIHSTYCNTAKIINRPFSWFGSALGDIAAAIK